MEVRYVAASGVLLAMMGVALAAKGTGAAVPYPEGYRSWRHVKSMVIQKGHPLYSAFGGIHHLYANDEAVAGYESGRFADGSVIVFDLLEANAAEGAIVAGKRKVVGVMVRDQNKFANTGGWGFEGFKGDSKTERAVGDQAATACFACHTAQQQGQYVFSRLDP